MAVVERTQWRSLEEIKTLQFRKFKKIINHAYNNVKFYRKKFDSVGIKPEDIKSMSDISRIPFTTKREIAQSPIDDLLARGYKLRRCHVETTSGSSGLKLQIAFDYRAKDFCDCIYGRALFAIGYKPWESMAYFWPQTNHKKEFHEYLGLMRKDWIASNINTDEQLRILLKLKPKIIYGFPSILVILAKKIEREKKYFNALRPRFIVSHAELLTEEARNYIESVFKCPVYNEYGATEFGFRMAWECKERQGLHIDADSVLIEFLKDDKPVCPGEKGEMVITGLVNYAMPLIRYKIGDWGVPSDRQCKCGRGLPLIERIEGRDDDFIVLPSGRVISPRQIVPLVEQFKEVREFKIVQELKNKITIYVVKDEKFESEISSKILNEIYKIIDKEVDVSIKFVEEIPRTPRGKLRAVISNVKR